MSVDNSELAARMKWYEQRYAHVVMPMIPVMARMDGRSFHTFTRGLKRPYDERLSRLMVEVTKFLVGETNARCGYTQSDEITLVWLAEDPDAEVFFGGKLLKMTSVIGSLTTAMFNKLLPKYIPERADAMPVFDSRVWEVPVDFEAVNNFIWREADATRNSIQMAGRAFFSHQELHQKNTDDVQEMLFSQKGINWSEYPAFFKRGTYVRKRVLKRDYLPEELASLPPKHHARTTPNLQIERTVVMEEVDLPPLRKLANRTDFILYGADPVTLAEVNAYADRFGQAQYAESELTL